MYVINDEAPAVAVLVRSTWFPRPLGTALIRHLAYEMQWERVVIHEGKVKDESLRFPSKREADGLSWVPA